MSQKANRHLKMASPVGQLTLVASGPALVAILWESERPGRVRVERGPEASQDPLLKEAATQLQAYFEGKRTQFELPLAPQGTDFQCKVWQALQGIPYGETRSYGELAAQIGAPGSARAVGAANGRNPLSIVVPCHRVIGANGQLTGFAGGLEGKACLLELERRQP